MMKKFLRVIVACAVMFVLGSPLVMAQEVCDDIDCVCVEPFPSGDPFCWDSDFPLDCSNACASDADCSFEFRCADGGDCGGCVPPCRDPLCGTCVNPGVIGGCELAGPVDSDADGVNDDLDACPDTVIPESVPTIRLGVNRWALVDNDGVFDTTLPPGGGNHPSSEFTLTSTDGCSCEQIIARRGLDQGHVKFGCSTGAMLGWVGMNGDDEGDDNVVGQGTIFDQNWRYPESVVETRREFGDN